MLRLKLISSVGEGACLAEAPKVLRPVVCVQAWALRTLLTDGRGMSSQQSPFWPSWGQ